MDPAIEEDNLLTLKKVRTAAMMHTAMHDALNSIIPRFSRYAYEGQIKQADPISAVAYAAFEVAISQYPEKKDVLESELNLWVKDITDEIGKNTGKEIGLEAAMSRVFLGIHFRYDSEEGHFLGTKIGEYATENFLKPLNSSEKLIFQPKGVNQKR